MATTTNYGWTTPDDTALVKDGAAAIRTLGSSVDTTTKALNPSTTLGDVEYRSSTANTNTRLGIGTTGQVLTVSGGVPAWSTISAGGMTLINSGGTTLTGASITISSIPGTYKDLQLVIRNFLPATDAQPLRIRLNGVTSTSYGENENPINNVSASVTEVTPGGTSSNAVSNGLIYATITDYANTATYKMIEMQSILTNATKTANMNYRRNVGWLYSTSAITSITFVPITGGSVFREYSSFALYGIKGA
jgi:hypothetical protein